MLSLLAPLMLSLHTAPDPVAKATELYWRAEFDSAAPWFPKALKKRPKDEKLAFLAAANLRRQGKARECLAATAPMLARNPCDARALQLRSDVWNPWSNPGEVDQDADSSRIYNERALACDSMYSDALLSLWVIARRTGDTAAQASSLRRLDAQRFWSRSVMSRARWTLEAAPPRAILITSGDANTYPLFILQRVKGMRPDVVLLDISLINVPEDPINAWTPALAQETGIDTADLRAMADSSRADDADSLDRDPEAPPVVWIGDRILRRLVQGQSGKAPRPVVVVVDQVVAMESMFPGRTQIRGPLLAVGTTEMESLQPDSVWTHLEGLDPQAFSGPATSDLDESPIRRSSRGHAAQIPLILAFQAASAKLRAEETKGAEKLLDWIEDFNEKSIRDDKFDEYLVQMRQALVQVRKNGN